MVEKCFFFISWFCRAFQMCLWFLNIPKWLIKVPGHIAIHFGTFLGLLNVSSNLALSQKHFKQYKKITKYFYGIVFDIIILTNYGHPFEQGQPHWQETTMPNQPA